MGVVTIEAEQVLAAQRRCFHGDVIATCFMCHHSGPITAGELAPAGEGDWACADGDACAQRQAQLDTHDPLPGELR